MDTFYALPVNKFYRYYELKFIKGKKEMSQNSLSKKIPYWYIFKKAFPQLFNVFLTMFNTIVVFPTVLVFIKPSDPKFFVPERFYTGILCFLTFNLFALIGSMTASFCSWPKPKFLIIPVLLRLIFIPLFLFCNYKPLKVERTLPVWIYNDWGFWALNVFFAFGSGYLSSVGMMYVPKTIEEMYSNVAGMYGGACLVTGIFVGVMFSFLAPTIVSIKRK